MILLPQESVVSTVEMREDGSCPLAGTPTVAGVMVSAASRGSNQPARVEGDGKTGSLTSSAEHQQILFLFYF